MATPSQYELDAWNEIQQFTGRGTSRRLRAIEGWARDASGAVGERAAKTLGSRPKTRAALERGQRLASRAAGAASAGAQEAVDAAPAWVSTTARSFQKTTGRVARAGLSPQRVVDKHRKRGHDVSTLHDVRRLDLEQVDAVRGGLADWAYPGVAALSGVGAGLAISGGELVTAVSAGAAAAPSGGVIAGAFAGDATAVLALSSRAVGRTALMYGYDPESPAEKLFVMSVVNAGSAASVGAKSAAFADISKLTQALTRDKTWQVLNETVLARVAGAFAKRFSFRLTKQGLGKVVPAAGFVVGGVLNWATLEGIIDTADLAYRRRFLLEKYPELAASDSFVETLGGEGEADVEQDEDISIVDEIARAGGPRLG